MGLRVRCMSLDWQLSCIAEICDNLSLIITDVRDLHIDASSPLQSGQDNMDPLPMLELFRQFSKVKRVFLTEEVALHVNYALKHEMATGVLLNAKVIELEKPNPSRPHTIFQAADPLLLAPKMRTIPLPSAFIHPRLAASNLQYDVRYHHSKINLRLSPTTLTEPASCPPLPSLMLCIGGLPWLFVVRPGSHTASVIPFVTVQDVLNAIYANLHTVVKPDECKAMSRYSDAAIANAFSRRVGADLVQLASGLLRIDFLSGRFRAQGLVPAQWREKDDVWDVLVY
ncbi:hypothetical protein BJV78DRAFT_1201642 [Lactifluus subvellereus]|nr:hypothetical protein BJV78DRAFT_1201642 [Lactifluus subvellereus]